MTKNLEKADAVVKLTLAASVIVLYFTHIIVGPFAKALAVLSGLMILISLVRSVYARKSRSRDKA